MISYAPLWKTMRRVGATSYTLQVKGHISSSTIRRLKVGDSVSTNTMGALCAILGCSLNDVIEYLSDTEQGRFLELIVIIKPASEASKMMSLRRVSLGI